MHRNRTVGRPPAGLLPLVPPWRCCAPVPVLALLVLLGGGPAAATGEEAAAPPAGPPAARMPPPPRDFTFRRIAVAPHSGGPRITVQIDPEEQARLLALRPSVPPLPDASPEAAAGAGGDATLGWFWTAVSPEIGAGAGRFQRALAVLGAPPPGATPVPPPRLAHLQTLAAAHGPALLRASVGTRVSPALALAVIAVESSGRADAVSPAGAQGLMQLIPATAARFGVSDAFDPVQNIGGGIAYLDWLMETFDGDVVLALAGYNAGEGAVQRNGGVPPFAETRAYVPRVLAAWQVARGLCLTPPELPGDGCVFVTRTAAAAP